MRIFLISCVMLFTVLPVASAAEPTGESYANRALRYTRVLEEHPFDPAALPMRSWLAQWITESPEVMVVVCDILGPVPDEDLPMGPELLLQYMAGNAAFQLRSPGSRADLLQPSLAGIASMLLAYRAMLQTSPQVRIPLYDEWIEQQATGGFERDRSAAIQENCSDPATPPPASATVEQQAVDDVAPQVPFLGGFLRETRILYPLRVGEWEAKGEKRYDDFAAGVSVRYSTASDERNWVDVFVYPVGAMTAGQVLNMAEREREGLIDAWLKDSRSKDEDISALRTFSLPTTAGDSDRAGPLTTAYSVDLTLVSNDERRDSAMVVLFHQLYLVKTRYSVRGARPQREAVRESLEQFTAQLLPHLTIATTGACWMPLPVEQLAEGAIAPDGHLLTVQQDGATVVHVYRDRVLARDPPGPAVDIAMRKGMQLLGRLHPGCDGSDPVNPDVGEGMREIRIEYPPPAEALPGTRRLRSPQRGLG